ncbi:MAG TPA: RNA polymerase sigma factor [Chloroflexia bacterium]|nr:RNA polymerase sigma factor [Chloroflexia bacterium]
MQTPTDEELMDRTMSGEATALGLLVQRHHGPLLGYLYRMCNANCTLAEDLAQETFIRVMRQANYQADRPFKPWLYAIATNLARDHAKSADTRYAVCLDKSDALPDAAPGPEELALAAEQGREVAQAIGSLPIGYRAAIVLRFYAGLSLQEIAAALDIPLGTVKSRLSVGCRRLRERLSNTYEEDEAHNGL